MILSFKKQFVKPILEGTKIHTIREDKHNRWRGFKVIHMATGVRSKNYNCFKKSSLRSTQKIFITVDNGLEVTIDGKYINNLELEKLAKNDGFESSAEMESWFEDAIKQSKEDCFSGKLIHWTDKRY